MRRKELMLGSPGAFRLRSEPPQMSFKPTQRPSLLRLYSLVLTASNTILTRTEENWSSPHTRLCHLCRAL